MRAVAGSGCGMGYSLVSFLFEDKERSLDETMVVDWHKPIAVSDLYRGRVGGSTVFVADALTPAEAECDRRRPSVDGTAGDCVTVAGEREMGKEVIFSESEG